MTSVLQVGDLKPALTAARLLELDTVVLAPHVASGTVETRAAMVDLTLANLGSWATRGQLLTPVRG